MASNIVNQKAIKVQKKQDETVYVVEFMNNKFTGVEQIQINDTYFDKDGNGPNYGRRGINIDIIDIPEVMAAMAKVYQERTGKPITL